MSPIVWCKYADACMACSAVTQNKKKTRKKCFLFRRHVLQLHHDDGGEQCGVDCGGAQLSPQVGSTITIQISPLNYHHRLLHIEQFGQILEIKLSYLISTITTGLRRPMWCPCGWVTFTFDSQNISSKNIGAHQFLTIQDAHVGEWLATQSLISSQSVSLHNQNKTQNHSLKHI